MVVLSQFNSFLRRFAIRHNLISTMSQIKTFVFMDLETTGLPHLEHNSTKITEFCAVAVQADHIELGCFPRVHNKLTLCFNPQKLISPESTDITGLSNDLLENQKRFSSDSVDIIKKWLEMNQKPICLVAHNGNKFDYPIFRAEVDRTRNSLPEDMLCIDSIMAFRQIDDNTNDNTEETKEEVPFEFNDNYDEILSQACEEFERKNLTPKEVQKRNETTPKKQTVSSQLNSQMNGRRQNISFTRKFGSGRSFISYKLAAVYTRLTSKEPCNAHEAENDVKMLITCSAVYGEKFVAYANKHSIKFMEIPPMRPGRKIGM